MSGILSFAGQIRNSNKQESLPSSYMGSGGTFSKSFLSVLAGVVLTAGLSWGGHAFAESVDTIKSQVHEYELDNGLRVLIKQDNRAPIAVVQLWYKVGSSYEHSGITGISHALEHMMFKGTEKYPTGEFNRIIGENGAQDNAFTSVDATVYHQTLASDRIDVAMELESDRMRGLTLPPEEFKKELEVVKEERRLRTDDRPNALTREQFQATAFLNNPYGNPVIGWMTDIEHLQVNDLRAWYDRWYAPNNATLVVVGDVEPDEIYAMAQKYYGPIPAREIIPPKPQNETKQMGVRHIKVKAPAEVPYVMMGYKIPALVDLVGTEREWEPYALEVLSSVLDGGNSSRMSRELIRGREIAASAAAWSSSYGRLPNLFTVLGVPAKDVDIAVVKAALLEQLERLKTESVTEKELARVKAQVIASEVFELDSVDQQAYLLGSLETVGLGYKLMDEYVERILAVTPEQIQQVASQYFVEDQLTIGELVPQAIDTEKTKMAQSATK